MNLSKLELTGLALLIVSVLMAVSGTIWPWGFGMGVAMLLVGALMGKESDDV